MSLDLAILDSYMARKSPSTMLKRANSMLRLTQAAASQGLAFPMSESELFEKSGGAALSQLRSVMEALTFTRFVFSVSSWGLGASRVAVMPSRACPLRVEDLKTLHGVVRDGKDPWDQLFAGCALFCAYGRARWSDAQHCGDFNIDRDPQTGRCAFLEALVTIRKTVNLKGSEPMCLELVSPGQRVTEDDWIAQFMDARHQLQLDKRFCFMPAPDSNGKPTVRALDTDECGTWLEKLLTSRECLRTTSHSLKATVLSYCAKYGMSHEDRLALGGHSHPYRLADVYGRDALARLTTPEIVGGGFD